MPLKLFKVCWLPVICKLLKKRWCWLFETNNNIELWVKQLRRKPIKLTLARDPFGVFPTFYVLSWSYRDISDLFITSTTVFCSIHHSIFIRIRYSVRLTCSEDEKAEEGGIEAAEANGNRRNDRRNGSHFRYPYFECCGTIHWWRISYSIQVKARLLSCVCLAKKQ